MRITPDLRVVVSVVVAGVFVVGGASSAHAEANPGDLITWSVAPATVDGKDGRSWAELDVDPGEVVEEHVAVTNHGKQTVTFALSAADGYFTETGRFTMLPSSEPSTGAGTWIDIQETVEVAPGATAVVPYAIDVPDNATPGDAAAGVAASVFSSGADDQGTAMGMESRVGIRVMLRVSGALTPSFVIDDTRAEYDTAWNPFRPGTLRLTYSVANTGNARVVLDPQIEASGRFGEAPQGERSEVELLPGEKRQLTATVTEVWPLGLTRVIIAADGHVTPGDAKLAPHETEVWVWTMPWAQLLVLLGLALIVAAFTWRRRQQRADFDRRLTTARQEAEAAVRAELASEVR